MNIMRSTFFAALLVASSLTGCSIIRQTDAPMKEPTLISAGFVAKPANTAQREADLATLTPYKIQMINHKGKVLYLYCDPKNKMIYAGGPKQYAAYKKIAVQQRELAVKTMNDREWDYFTATYGEGMAGNPSVIY